METIAIDPYVKHVLNACGYVINNVEQLPGDEPQWMITFADESYIVISKKQSPARTTASYSVVQSSPGFTPNAWVLNDVLALITRVRRFNRAKKD
jgi:hypothetical protein